MRLVEQHTIKPSSVYYNELYDLLHKCKNLYNNGFVNMDPTKEEGLNEDCLKLRLVRSSMLTLMVLLTSSVNQKKNPLM